MKYLFNSKELDVFECEKSIKYPYKEYEQSQLWKLIDKAIDDLVINQDIELNTRKEYILGYLCKMIKSELKNQE